MSPLEPRLHEKRAPSASPFSVLPSRPLLGPELGIRNRGTPPSLPGAAITRLGIFAQAHLSQYSDRSLVLNAAFRSTAMMFRVATDPHSHVDVPGLHLRTRPVLLPAPVRLPASRTRRIFQPGEPSSLRVARCPVQSQNAPLASVPPLPSRTSRSFGLFALGPAPTGETCLSRSLIRLHSPPRLRS